MEPQCYRLKEVANILDVSEKSVRRMIEKGTLPALKLPVGGYRIDRKTFWEQYDKWQGLDSEAQNTGSNNAQAVSSTSHGPNVVSPSAFQQGQKTGNQQRPS